MVQLALEKAHRSTAATLAEELRGSVQRCIASAQANYVIQKVVEVLPASMCSFIVAELQGSGAKATRHAYGCRVICRLIEHSLSAPAVDGLMLELLMEAEDLCRHAYGHYVMEHLLEHGSDRHKQLIVNALLQDMHLNARNRYATYVIEKALLFAISHDREALFSALVADPENIISLADNQFGYYVVMSLLSLEGHMSKTTQDIIEQATDRLVDSKHGARVLEELRSC